MGSVIVWAKVIPLSGVYCNNGFCISPLNTSFKLQLLSIMGLCINSEKHVNTKIFSWILISLFFHRKVISVYVYLLSLSISNCILSVYVLSLFSISNSIQLCLCVFPLSICFSIHSVYVYFLSLSILSLFVWSSLLCICVSYQ